MGEQVNAGLCYLVLHGRPHAEDLRAMQRRSAQDCVICADSGFDAIAEEGIAPEYIVGDFDSTKRTDFPDGAQIVRAPAHKDDTDAVLAARLGLRLGYRRFRLIGGMGGRLDHTVANFGLLAMLTEAGAQAVMRDADCEAMLLQNGAVTLTGGDDRYLSVFAYSDVCTGVHLTGTEYPLVDATLKKSFPVGVSNHIAAAQATVSVQCGTLLILRTK